MTMSLVRCLVGSRVHCNPLILVRGKKKVVKNAKSIRKSQERQEMKNRLKQAELEKQLEEAVLRVARQGEPMDPEMLNPARKRLQPKMTKHEYDKELLLVKEWTRYKMEKHKQDLRKLQAMQFSRNKAMNALRKTSYPLYLKALETRLDLFPFDRTGPTETPPLDRYHPPELEEE